MNERDRLQAMIAPGQQTWDLSPNDVSAIFWALKAIELFETACKQVIEANDYAGTRLVGRDHAAMQEVKRALEFMKR